MNDFCLIYNESINEQPYNKPSQTSKISEQFTTVGRGSGRNQIKRNDDFCEAQGKGSLKGHLILIIDCRLSISFPSSLH